MNVSANSFVFFKQALSSNFLQELVEQSLPVSQGISQNLPYSSPVSHFSPVQTVRVSKTISLVASNSLQLTGAAVPRAYIEQVAQHLLFTQSAEKLPTVKQLLSLTQLAQAALSKGASSVLVMTSAATVQVVRNSTVEQVLHLLSRVAVYGDSKLCDL